MRLAGVNGMRIGLKRGWVVGGTIGAILGPVITTAFVKTIGVSGLLLVACAGFGIVIALMHLLMHEKNNLRVKFAVYNVLNQQRTLGVDQDLQTSVGGLNPTYLQPQRFQSPRFGQLTVSLDF